MICPNCKQDSISAVKLVLKRYKGMICPKCFCNIVAIENKKIFWIPSITVSALWFLIALIFNVGQYGDLYVYLFLLTGLFLGIYLEVFLNIKMRKLK